MSVQLHGLRVLFSPHLIGQPCRHHGYPSGDQWNHLNRPRCLANSQNVHEWTLFAETVNVKSCCQTGKVCARSRRHAFSVQILKCRKSLDWVAWDVSRSAGVMAVSCLSLECSGVWKLITGTWEFAFSWKFRRFRKQSPLLFFFWPIVHSARGLLSLNCGHMECIKWTIGERLRDNKDNNSWSKIRGHVVPLWHHSPINSWIMCRNRPWDRSWRESRSPVTDVCLPWTCMLTITAFLPFQERCY